MWLGCVTDTSVYRSRRVPVRYSTSSSKLKKKSALTASEPDILAAIDNEGPSVMAADKVTERVPSLEMPNNLPGMAKLSHSVEALDRSPSPSSQRGVLASPFKTPSKIPSPKTAMRSK